INILEKAVEFYKGKDALKEAAAQVNLSLCYIKASRFHDGAKAAQRALALFRELEDDAGIYNSLVNLSTCAGALGDTDLQEKYALEIIKESNERQLWRLKCAGLNHLAVVQRRKKDPIAAQRSLEECIAIARKIESVEV